MRGLTTKIYADYDRAAGVLFWIWEVLDSDRIVLHGLADSRVEARQRSDRALRALTTVI
jgi:hypothetical protein